MANPTAAAAMRMQHTATVSAIEPRCRLDAKLLIPSTRGRLRCNVGASESVLFDDVRIHLGEHAAPWSARQTPRRSRWHPIAWVGRVQFIHCLNMAVEEGSVHFEGAAVLATVAIDHRPRIGGAGV